MKNKILILLALTSIVITGCGNTDMQKEVERGMPKDAKVDDVKAVGPAGKNQTLVENKNLLPNRSELNPAVLKEISEKNPGLIDADQKIFESKKGTVAVALFFTNDSDAVGREMIGNFKKYEGLVPGGIVLLKLNFDQEKDLVKMLSVKQAGEWVVFDKKGLETARSSGSNFDELIMTLNKAVIK